MPAPIFISYRRDDLQGHARALHEFLAPRFAPGAIFFDRDDSSIVGGDDFLSRIADALQDAEVVLVLIGPGWAGAVDNQGRVRLHQPHDVVRFEIETALNAAGKRVIPVLFDGCPMPGADALPAGLSALAARDAVPLGGKAAEFQRAREHLCALVEGLPGVSSARRRQALRSPAERKLQEIQRHYLGRDDRRPAFVGREPALAALDGWLADPSAPRRLLLTGAAAMGKSSLLLHWLGDPLGTRQGWTLVFVPISVRFDTNTPEMFWSMLATRLARLAEMGAEAPKAPAGERTQDLALDALERLENEGRKLLFVIDGLDEAGGWEIDPHLLAAQGAHLRWLVSARAVGADSPATDRWLQRLGWSRGRSTRVLELQPLGRAAVVEAVLRQVPKSEEGPASDLADEAWRVSAGDPMLLGYILDDLADLAEGETIDVAAARRALDGVVPGFAGYFNGWLDRQRPYWTHQDGRSPALDGLLALLACAHGPLGIVAVEELLAQAYGLREPLVTSLLHRLHRFVLDTADGLVLAHPRMAFHIQQEFPADGDRMKRARRSFLEWGGQARPSAAGRRYLAHHFAQHLSDPQNGATLDQLLQLTRAGWVRLSLGEDDSGRLLALDLDLAGQALDGHGLSAPLETAHRWTVLLMACSVRTRARIEPELLAAHVREGLSTSRQAVRRLELMKPRERALGFALIAARLPPEERTDLLGQAIQATSAIADFSDRAAAWGQVLPALADAAQRDVVEAMVLDGLNQAGSMYHWLQAVDWIAPGLSPKAQRHLLHWTFHQVGGSEEPGCEWHPLDAFMPHIHESLQSEAVSLAMRCSAELGHEASPGSGPGRCGAIADAALPHVFACLTPQEQDASWQRVWAQTQADRYDTQHVIGVAMVLPWLLAQGREDEARKKLTGFASRSGAYVTADTLIRFAQMTAPSAISSVARERAVETLLGLSNDSSKQKLFRAASGILDASLVARCFQSLMTVPPPARWSQLAALASRLTRPQLETVRSGQLAIGDAATAHLAALALRANDFSTGDRASISATVSALRTCCADGNRPDTMQVLRQLDPSRWDEVFGSDLPWLAGGESELLMARPTLASGQAEALWATIQEQGPIGRLWPMLRHRRILNGLMPDDTLTEAARMLIHASLYKEAFQALEDIPADSAAPLQALIAGRIERESRLSVREFPAACLMAIQGPVTERPRWRDWVEATVRGQDVAVEYRVWQLKLRTAQERPAELEAIRQACLDKDPSHGEPGLTVLVHELSDAEAERFVELWLRLAGHACAEDPSWLSKQRRLPEPLANATLAALDRLLGAAHRTELLEFFVAWAPEIARFLGPAGVAVLAEGIDAAREGFE